MEAGSAGGEMMSRVEHAAHVPADSKRRRFRVAVVLVSVAVAAVGATWLAIRSTETAETAGASVALKVPKHPGALAAGPDALWVALSRKPHDPGGGGRLLRLDLSTGTRAEPVYLGGEISNLTHVGDHLIASVQHPSRLGQLAVVDWRTGDVLDRHWFERPVDQVLGFRGRLWALESGPAALLRIDAKTLEPAAPIRLSRGRTLGMASGGGYLWVTAADDGEVLRIDPETRAIRRARAGGSPVGVVFTGGSVWVADHEGGKVVRLDPRSLRRVGDPIRVGANPSRLVAAADSLFVVDEHDGKVLRIDTRTGKRVGLPIRIAWPTGDAPAPSVAPAAESIWVSSFASNTLDRIDSTAGADAGRKLTVRISGTNDQQQGDAVTNGALAGRGRFAASGAISQHGKVAVYRTVKGTHITLRYVISDRTGTITFVTKVDTNYRTAHWTITSAAGAYQGLRGEGTEIDTHNFTVQTLIGTVTR
jgi:streptogramin lyase